MEPGITQAVPGVGVVGVTGEELLIEGASLGRLALHEGAVGVDDRSLVGRKVAREGGGAADRPLADRIVRSAHPAPGERELEVGQSEGGVERDGALEIALGAGQVPPVEVLHPAQIGAESLQRLGGRARQSDADLVGGAGQIQQLGGQIVEERAGRRGPARSSTRATSTRFPDGHIEDPGGEVQRVAGRGKIAQHHGPDTGLARQPPSHVEADVVAHLEPVAGQQVMQPLVVHHRQIVPLGQVESQHADAAVPEPIHRALVAQVVEREHQNRVAGIDPARWSRATADQGGGSNQETHRHCRQGNQPWPAEVTGRRHRPLSRHGLTKLLAGLPTIGGLLLQRPHDCSRQLSRGFRATRSSGTGARRCAWRPPPGGDPGRADGPPASHRRPHPGRTDRSGCRSPPRGLFRTHVHRRSHRHALAGARAGRHGTARAMPKSASIARPVTSSSSTFSGFTSRWTTPARLDASSAAATSERCGRSPPAKAGPRGGAAAAGSHRQPRP